METREHSRDFLKGGHTRCSPDSRVDLHAVFYSMSQRKAHKGRGLSRAPQEPPGHTLETKLPIHKLLQKMNIKRVSSFTWACRLCSSPFSICLTRPSLRSHQIVTDITAETDDGPILVIGGILLSICRSTRVTTGSLFE